MSIDMAPLAAVLLTQLKQECEEQHARAEGLNSLLKKYIQHVVDCEGCDFLRNGDRSQYSDFVDFTDEEWAKLRQLSEEPFGPRR